MKEEKTAIISGIGGQDGSYLAEILLDKGYRVIGVCRRSSTNNRERVAHLEKKVEILEGDITDASFISRLISFVEPDEVYSLAAMSHVHNSYSEPQNTFNINTLGVINILEAIRNFSPQTRLFQASTSEMFGSNVECGYQLIDTPFNPVSPYAVSKLASHHLIQIYRKAYGLYACSVIMMNHESPRRGENFVTRKITKWIGKNLFKIRSGQPVEKLKLGNLNSYRDWSHAEDFMRAAYEILQQDEPDEYLLCSGNTHTIQEFLDIAFDFVHLNSKDWVEIDSGLFRPTEVDYLCGQLSDSVEKLNWKPKYTFTDLVKSMVMSDIALYDKH